MFKKSILALTAAAIMASALPATSYARDGGGGREPYAIAKHPDKTVTSRRNKDGSRTVTTRFKNGKVVKKKIRKPKKKVRKVRRKSRPWASSTDTRTGRTILSVGNGDGSRTVFHFSAFGGLIGIGISN